MSDAIKKRKFISEKPNRDDDNCCEETMGVGNNAETMTTTTVTTTNVSQQGSVTVDELLSTQNTLETLDRALEQYSLYDGHVGQCAYQMAELIRLAKGKRNILEIGFHAGHSAAVFLANAHPEATVTSVDIGEHTNYLPSAKLWIDRTFPGRHHLILGDSKEILKSWSLHAQNTVCPRPRSYDLIFIDGGQDYVTVLSDFTLCYNHLWKKESCPNHVDGKEESHPVLILNNVSPPPYPQGGHTAGASRVWLTEVEFRLGPMAPPSTQHDPDAIKLCFKPFHSARGMGWLTRMKTNAPT
jgi:predicted O-methyltransferase YrrM